MAKITTIPATRPFYGTITQAEDIAKKKRVAAYCRVSTDTDEQESSYDTQVNHYTSYINGKAEWEFAGVFTDEGISGTNTKNRKGFNKMIEDCNAGKIDMIITKSISRFARNTVDCLNYIRQLKDIGVEICFEKENINTFDSKGEMMITIMASLAQQESESLSRNVKMGLKFRYQQGKVSINHNWFLGYTKDENGNLVIDPCQAEVVKRIYREYLDGYSMDQIKAGLEADGIPTGANKKKWYTGTIKRILTNEKYIGDALLQKTVTVDILNKKRINNDGREVQYYIEHDHEPIISKAIFSRVQEELQRRAELKKNNLSFSGKYGLANVCKCGNCGSSLYRVHWYIGGHRVVWRCKNRMSNGVESCDFKSIDNRDIEKAVVQAVNQLLKEKSSAISIVKENILNVTGCYSEYNLTTAIDSRIKDLEQKIVEMIRNGNDYSSTLEQIDNLKNEKSRILEASGICKKEGDIMSGILDFLENQAGEVMEYDDNLTRRLIDEIMIQEENVIISFKHGQKVKVNN